jgi:hypothetical protein
MPSTNRPRRVTDDPIIVGALAKTNAFRKVIGYDRRHIANGIVLRTNVSLNGVAMQAVK